MRTTELKKDDKKCVGSGGTPRHLGKIVNESAQFKKISGTIWNL